MRVVHRLAIPCSLVLFFCNPLRAETAVELEIRGAAALKLAQAQPDAIVSATICYGKAAAAYGRDGNEAKATEMNSFLYWCKKKMTLQQMDVFLKGEAPETAMVARRLKDVDQAPKPEELKAYFARAERYAADHPAEHMLIAIRFFEVADRFKGSEQSFQAQDRSLKEIALAQMRVGAVEPAVSPKSAPGPGKKSVPTAAQIKEAEKVLLDAFKEDFAKTTHGEKFGLAMKLEQQADGSKEDSVGKFVLLSNAAHLAAQGAALSHALVILEKLGADFNVDLKDLTRSILAEAAASIRAPARAKYATAMKTLVDAPDNTAANLTVGKYACSVLGDYTYGLPHLAKAGNSGLSAIAKKDLATPGDTAVQTAIADAWFEFGEKAGDKDEKAMAQDRAALWYRKLLPSVGAILKLKMEKRLAELADAACVRPIRGKTADLLAQVELPRDSARGNWAKEDRALVGTATNGAELGVPYNAGADYDLHMVLARVKGDGDIGPVLAWNGQGAQMSLAGWNNRFAGLNSIDGMWADNSKNPTHTNNGLSNGVPYDLLVQVRRQSIRAVLNGKQMFLHKFQSMTFSLGDEFKFRDGKTLGIYCNHGTYSITVFEVTIPYERGPTSDFKRLLAANSSMTTLVETSEKTPHTWRYTTENPGEGWFKSDFDDSKWQEGPGAIGTPVPGATLRTPWTTSDIWIRRAVQLEASDFEHAQLRCHHDDEAEFYINGVFAGRAEGWTVKYVEHEMTPEARKVLKPGINVIAARCHQESGAQVIDFGIVSGK